MEIITLTCRYLWNVTSSWRNRTRPTTMTMTTLRWRFTRVWASAIPAIALSSPSRLVRSNISIDRKQLSPAPQIGCQQLPQCSLAVSPRQQLLSTPLSAFLLPLLDVNRGLVCSLRSPQQLGTKTDWMPSISVIDSHIQLNTWILGILYTFPTTQCYYNYYYHLDHYHWMTSTKHVLPSPSYSPITRRNSEFIFSMNVSCFHGDRFEWYPIIAKCDFFSLHFFSFSNVTHFTQWLVSILVLVWLESSIGSIDVVALTSLAAL